jgi:23S rRNA (adenine2030-N6)-methyltransferase
MLSYRHAFHAGNHADILKHLILLRCLQHMNKKDKPYTVIDTHAGAGRYALESKQANKTGEYLTGIGRLWECVDLPPLLLDFVATIRLLNPDGLLRQYPGSPWLIQQLARPADHIRLCELHTTDAALLRRQFATQSRRVHVEQADGFAMLKASLPPPSRRALVLIDPSYELKSDYANVIVALQDSLKRFATGMYLVWHPLLSSLDASRLTERLRKIGADDWLHATLTVRAPNSSGHGMHGSSLFVINPPWTLAAELTECLPVLANLLALDDKASWQLEQATPAKPATSEKTTSQSEQATKKSRHKP